MMLKDKKSPYAGLIKNNYLIRQAISLDKSIVFDLTRKQAGLD